MFKILFSPAFALEAQQVIWLRALKIMAGGPEAQREVIKMTTEKLDAAQHAYGSLLLGATPEKVLRSYRSKVRANLRRLSR